MMHAVVEPVGRNANWSEKLVDAFRRQGRWQL